MSIYLNQPEILGENSQENVSTLSPVKTLQISESKDESTPDQTSLRVTVNQFIPLELETRPAIPTDAAAYHLNRKPQTLRVWAAEENGPIRINKRLAWSVEKIRVLLKGQRDD